MGRPSPAADSPLDVSRSTGPHPLVAVNGRSLTQFTPVGGGVGTPTVVVAVAESSRPRTRYVAAALRTAAAGWSPAGAVTCHCAMNDPPAATRPALVGVMGVAVQPSTAVSRT